MKVLKIIGIIVIVLIILIILLGLFAPKDYHVERSVTINAPKELVFNHVQYWRNWKTWSPWAERDSLMEITIEGKDGEKGAVYKWVGDPEITGSGSMTATEVKQFEEISYHLHFVDPWESESDGYVKLADEGEGCKASWGFSGEMGFPMNIMAVFMSMDAMLGPDFERGLELLKNIAEKEAKAVLNYEVNQVDFSAKKYAAIQKTVSFMEMQSFFGGSYAEIQKAMKKKWARSVGAPAGLYYSWDEVNMTTDVAAAIPSNKNVKKDNVKTIELEAGKAFSVDYYGAYDKVGNAHKALDLHIKKNGLTFKAPVIEEYITNPQTEPDTSKWLTKIYWFAEQ